MGGCSRAPAKNPSRADRQLSEAALSRPAERGGPGSTGASGSVRGLDIPPCSELVGGQSNPIAAKGSECFVPIACRPDACEGVLFVRLDRPHKSMKPQCLWRSSRTAHHFGKLRLRRLRRMTRRPELCPVATERRPGDCAAKSCRAPCAPFFTDQSSVQDHLLSVEHAFRIVRSTYAR